MPMRNVTKFSLLFCGIRRKTWRTEENAKQKGAGRAGRGREKFHIYALSDIKRAAKNQKI